MKVVVVGAQHPDSLARCVVHTLKGLGHDVNVADEREMLGVSFRQDVEKGRLRTWTLLKLRGIDLLMKAFPKFELYIYEKLSRIIESHEPDLVITHSTWIPPQTISRLKQMTKATVVCWFPDHPGNLGRQYLLAGKYDALFFKDKYLVEMASRIGLEAFYLPECCEPKWHNRVVLSQDEQKKYGCDVTIAGNLYYYRAAILEALMSVCDVKIWGPPMPRWLDSPVRKVHQNRTVVEFEKSKAFSGAKIVINTFQGEVAGVNLRTFEAAACGAFQICEYRKELEELFIPGEEIEAFRTLDELIQKVRYYLDRPEERRRIAEKGYERAHREHTYNQRITQLLGVVSDLKMKQQDVPASEV